jgi:putative transcriptional regulator
MKERSNKGSIGSRLIEGLREFADSLEKKERITQKYNCRVVELDLRPTSYTPEIVRETRKLLEASQTVFAQFLGVSPNTVRAWEQGLNVPKDVACRFMDEIRRDPEYWRKRLRESAVVK